MPGPITKLRSATPNDGKDLAMVATEGLWAYHIKNQRFRSTDFAIKIFKACFEPKPLCVSTMCEAINANILVPYVEKKLDNQKKDATKLHFADASNYGNTKLPIYSLV